MKKSIDWAKYIFVALIISIIVLSFFTIINNSRTDVISNTDASVSWEDNWSLRTSNGNEIIQIPYTDKNPAQETIILMKKLPDHILSNTAFYIKTDYKPIRIMIDGNPIPLVGKGNWKIERSDQMLPWSAILIPSDASGKELSIQILPGGSKKKIEIYYTYLGEIDFIRNEIMRKAFIPVFLSVLLFLLSLLLLTLSIIYKNEEYKEYTTYISLYIMFSALWFIADSDIQGYFFLNNETYFLVNILSYLMLSIPFLKCIQIQYKENGKTVQTVRSINVLCVLLVIGFILAGKDHLWIILTVSHIAVAIILGICLTISIKEYFKNKNSGIDFRIIGISALMISAFGTAYSFYFNADSDNISYYRYGILFFIILLIINAVRAGISIAAKAENFEQVRISEEEYRIAAKQTNKFIYRYDIKSHTASHDPTTGSIFEKEPKIENIPEEIIKRGIIEKGSINDFKKFFHDIENGRTSGSAVFRILNKEDSWRWYKGEFTTIFNNNNEPAQSILSFTDITELHEKELAYDRWQQEFKSQDPNNISYYEYNLTKDIYETEEGKMLQDFPITAGKSLNQIRSYTAENIVFPEDRDKFLAFYSRERMMNLFQTGKYSDQIVCRRIGSEGKPYWTEITIQMIPDPYSSDVKVFIIAKDVDQEKRTELELTQKGRTDPLTGLLNRATLVEDVNNTIREKPNQTNALIMIDIDNFKKVNDVFGHLFGDKLLISIGEHLRSVLREGDLVSRSGGDEFIIFLIGIPDKLDFIQNRSKSILELLYQKLSDDLEVSGSIGIALYPKDGTTFTELYEKADTALYHAKHLGKNRCVIYSTEIAEKEKNIPNKVKAISERDIETTKPLNRNVEETPNTGRKTLLIVDDSQIDRLTMIKFFEKDYATIEAANGKEALEKLNEFGTIISLVLLDIRMPDIDGLTILKKMQEDAFFNTIPVIMVSSIEEKEICLKAIELGAADFISKPINPELAHFKILNIINRGTREQAQILKRIQYQQEKENNRYQTILQNTGTIVFEYDANTQKFTYDSLAPKFLYGKFDNRSLWDIFDEDGTAETDAIIRMRQFLEKAVKNNAFSSGNMVERLMTPEKVQHWFNLSVIRKANEEQIGKAFILTFRDVEDEIAAQNRLTFFVEYDELTKIYKRDIFIQKTSEFLKKCKPNDYVMVRFDIERFKVLNDMFGRSEGDRILKYIGARLRRHSIDFITFGRINADIFAFCMKNDPQKLEKIIGEDCQDIATYDLPFDIVLSYGIYIIMEPNIPVDLMLDRAAMAEKTVKGSYLQRFAYYDEKMRRKMLEEQSILSTMNAALTEKRFEIYLQPKCRLDTGEITGAEALIRWNQPDGSVLMPSTFIPIFEKNGFIVKLDTYIWEQVCQFIRKRLDANKVTIPLSISTNISRVNIYNPKLTGTLVDLAKKYNIPPDMLDLEITESAYTEDPELLKKVIEELKSHGFIVEMDDFGSGYSSLNMLKDIHVDVLKLDMYFLYGGDDSGRGKNILTSVVRMAKWLGLPVIAEGVETAEEADFLRGIGCSIAQGFYFYKPMTITDFEMMLDTQPAISITKIQTLANSFDADEIWKKGSEYSAALSNRGKGCFGIFELDKGNIEAIQVNDAYLKLIGEKPEDLYQKGKNVLINVEEEDRKVLLDTLQKALSSHLTETCIYYYHCPMKVIQIKASIRFIRGDEDRSLYFVSAVEED